jgi:hypothetical protein
LVSTTGSNTWCNTYTYSYWGLNSYECGDLDFFDIETTFTRSGETPTTSAPAWVTTTYTGLGFADAGIEATTMRKAAPQIVESESELGPHVGEITAAVVGATFGFVLLTIVGLFVCLRKRTQPSESVKFVTTQESYGRPLVSMVPDRIRSPFLDDRSDT